MFYAGMKPGRIQRSEPIVISDQHRFSTSQLLVPRIYRDDISHIMIPTGLIADRIEAMALDIFRDYSDKEPHLLCVLKGGEQFFSDLKHYLQRYQLIADESRFHVTTDFLELSSYAGDQSTGQVSVVGQDIEQKLSRLSGRNVVVIEDIIDTGLTMRFATQQLLPKFNPATLAVAALLVKRTPKSCGFTPHYTGFSISDEFVIGYCLDYKERYRDLKPICVMSDSAKRRFGLIE